MSEHSIELHIEELVLNGFAPDDGPHIGHAVERELTRLLGERGLPLAHSSEITNLDAGEFDVAPHSGAETVGVLTARAVHRGLNK